METLSFLFSTSETNSYELGFTCEEVNDDKLDIMRKYITYTFLVLKTVGDSFEKQAFDDAVKDLLDNK